MVKIACKIAENIVGKGGNAGHNSDDSVPTSNLVCIKEVAIRTTFCRIRWLPSPEVCRMRGQVTKDRVYHCAN